MPEGSRDIYVIGWDRRIPKQLTKNPSNDANPGWSADGKWIYFQSDRTGEDGVWKVPVDGGEAVPVLGVRGGAPVESPDGKFIYYDKDARHTAFGEFQQAVARKIKSSTRSILKVAGWL